MAVFDPQIVHTSRGMRYAARPSEGAQAGRTSLNGGLHGKGSREEFAAGGAFARRRRTTARAVGRRAKKKHKKPKKVNYNALYSATNNPAGNAVVWWRRNANGTLTQKGTVKTGGKGIAMQQPFGFPIEDSSGSIALTNDGKLLFVPNAGDNTISAFQITSKGPKLVDRVTSGGILPVSLTVHKNTLYILNEVSGTIFGYHFTKTGFLTPIVNSEQALSTVGNLGVAAQIGFDPSGKTLVVSLRALPATKGTIDTFKVNGDGSTGPATQITADDANPFGFAFAGERLIISNVGFVATPPGVMPNPVDPTQFNGTTSSYNLSGTSLTLNNTAVEQRSCRLLGGHQQGQEVRVRREHAVWLGARDRQRQGLDLAVLDRV